MHIEQQVEVTTKQATLAPLVKFYPSEEIIRKFSWDFCLFFHGSVNAVFKETDISALDDEHYMRELRCEIARLFYASIQKYSDQEAIRKLAAKQRFAINTLIDLNRPDIVKIVADLIPVEIAERVHDLHMDDQFLSGPQILQ